MCEQRSIKYIQHNEEGKNLLVMRLSAFAEFKKYLKTSMLGIFNQICEFLGSRH